MTNQINSQVLGKKYMQYVIVLVQLTKSQEKLVGV